MKRPVPVESASALIDKRINELGDWRGKTLAKVRGIITSQTLRSSKSGSGWGLLSGPTASGRKAKL
jgi:hypothetical protein